MPDDATEGVAEHSFLGCNHQSTCMPQLQPLCSAALVPNVLPRRNEGSGIHPVQSIEPHRILAPTRDSNQGPPGSRVQSSNHYTTAALEGRLRNIV